MNSFFEYLKSISSITLIIVFVALTIIAKLLEKYSANTALGIQLITFILFVTALIKFSNTKKR